MQIGGKYNWINQSERLIYIGKNWSGNGYWHQFEKVDKPGVIWCEITDNDLCLLEKSQELKYKKQYTALSVTIDTRSEEEINQEKCKQKDARILLASMMGLTLSACESPYRRKS